MSARLAKLTIRGFKTIRALEDFVPGTITVLIGPNGAGKSNFISFFRMLSWSLVAPGNLQAHVGEAGGASTMLWGGPSVTPQIEASLCIDTERGRNSYAFRLFYAAGDTFVFADERYRFAPTALTTDATWSVLGAGHKEAKLLERAEGGVATAGAVRSMLQKLIVHQFHNTSATARMRGKWAVDDGRWLKEDGGNLGPFLFRLQREQAPYYRRIVETLRNILPFFADFVFEVEHDRLLLRWRERHSDVTFSASQAADGMLRVMALVALLLQPERDLPNVLILDEPELGLHPFAIAVVAGLIRSASSSVQVVVATQSVSLIDAFAPEEIVVVERGDGGSTFRRLDRTSLTEWLEDYSVSELWEKNVLGGRPQ